MEVHILRKKKGGTILAVCAEYAELLDIKAKYKYETKEETHPIVNSLGNLWKSDAELRKLAGLRHRFKTEIEDKVWCKSVRIEEIENQGHVILLELLDKPVYLANGESWVRENYPDLTFEGVPIVWTGRKLLKNTEGPK